MKATAKLIDARGVEVGRAEFRESPAGVGAKLTVSGLPPGLHGVHIHAVGLCEPPEFTSARAHFNPDDKKHGTRNPDGPHAGDLPNINIGSDGKGTLETVSTRIAVDGASARSVLREGGTAIVIHAGPDDELTDPIGNSGIRLACGVIGPP